MQPAPATEIAAAAAAVGLLALLAGHEKKSGGERKTKKGVAFNYHDFIWLVMHSYVGVRSSTSTYMGSEGMTVNIDALSTSMQRL